MTGRPILPLVIVDDQRRSDPLIGAPPRPMFLRINRLHRLPILALDGGGRPVVRFASPLIAAHYLNAEPVRPLTLPLPALDQLHRLL